MSLSTKGEIAATSLGKEAYAQNFLPASVTSRPLRGDAPIVDLVLGYRQSNQSPILKLLLSRLDELVARVSKKADKLEMHPSK